MKHASDWVYLKTLLRNILGDRWDDYTERRRVDLAGTNALLDGVILDRDREAVEVAVGIEARSERQIRGALVDLFLHTAPKKLLIVVPKECNIPRVDYHCTYVWKRLNDTGKDNFRVVLISGDVSKPDSSDLDALWRGLSELKVV
ncbi:MAG TPA: hypothetical protein VGK99_10085 [Acidobacteriota bacterium]|jgi:hypothetical protein